MARCFSISQILTASVSRFRSWSHSQRKSDPPVVYLIITSLEITETLKLLLKSCRSTATSLPRRDFKPMLPQCCFSNSELLPCHGAAHSPCVNMSAAVPLELPAEHSSPIHQRLSQHYMLVFHPIFHCTVHNYIWRIVTTILWTIFVPMQVPM